ncbi:hypothetical protein B7P43_G04937 [Cryptotermes secundus]|nr:hypothetical protein B7P43_G04937 [Cryptotermes secundus]
MGHLSHMAQSVGGSLLSIGSLEKRKSLKKLAKNLVRKGKKNNKEVTMDCNNDFRSSRQMSSQVAGDADPGVISEGESEDDFTFDDLSHKSSGSSINTNQTNTVTPVVGSLENLAGGEVLRRTSTAPLPSPAPLKSTMNRTVDEWEQKLYGKQGKDSNIDTLKRRSWDKSLLSSQPEEEEPEAVPVPKEPSPPRAVTPSPVTQVLPPTPPVPSPQKLESGEPEKKEDEKEKVKESSRLTRKFKQLYKENKLPETPQTEERIIIGGENEGSPTQSPPSRLPPEVLHKFKEKSREDLIEMICSLQASVDHQSKKLKDLEDYLDNLLLRVMETTPRILQNPYVSCKTQANFSH